MQSISLTSIPNFNAAERAEALAIVRTSLASKTEDGQEMIKLLEFLSADDPPVVSGKVGGLNVKIAAGADGKFGTADDVTSVTQ